MAMPQETRTSIDLPNSGMFVQMGRAGLKTGKGNN